METTETFVKPAGIPMRAEPTVCPLAVAVFVRRIVYCFGVLGVIDEGEIVPVNVLLLFDWYCIEASHAWAPAVQAESLYDVAFHLTEPEPPTVAVPVSVTRSVSFTAVV